MGLGALQVYGLLYQGSIPAPQGLHFPAQISERLCFAFPLPSITSLTFATAEPTLTSVSLSSYKSRSVTRTH